MKSLILFCLLIVFNPVLGQYLTISGSSHSTINGEWSQNACLDGHVAYMKSILEIANVGGQFYLADVGIISKLGETWSLWSEIIINPTTSEKAIHVWDSFVSDTPSPPCGSIFMGGSISSSGGACYTPNCVTDPIPPPALEVCSGNEAGIDLGNLAYWYDTPEISCTPVHFGQYRSIPNFTESKIFYLRNKTSCGYSNAVPFEVLALAAPTPPLGSENITCLDSTITLHTSCQNGVVKWYDSNLFGNLLGSGNSFTTPTITNNTTYYASCESSCGSSTRSTHTVSLHPNGSLNLSGAVESGNYKVSNHISSTQSLIPTAMVSYNAGASVELLPGFKTDASSIFIAQIGGCP